MILVDKSYSQLETGWQYIENLDYSEIWIAVEDNKLDDWVADLLQVHIVGVENFDQKLLIILLVGAY